MTIISLQISVMTMFDSRKSSIKLINSLKISVLLVLFLVLYLSNVDCAYAQGINIQILSNNSLARMDALVRIDKGIDARLYEYKNDRSVDLSPEQQFLNAGLEQSSNKDFEGAITHYTQALQLNSTFAKAYVSRAYARTQIGQREKAFQDYQKALEIEPKLVDAYIGRGNIYFSQGDNQLAINDFELAISINSNYYDAYFSRGSVYLNIENYKEANKDFSEAISLNPQYIDAYVQRGYVKSSLKD